MDDRVVYQPKMVLDGIRIWTRADTQKSYVKKISDDNVIEPKIKKLKIARNRTRIDVSLLVGGPPSTLTAFTSYATPLLQTHTSTTPKINFQQDFIP